MKVDIVPNQIKKESRNQITSSEIFKKNQRRVSNDFKYDENGIFSKKIFGKFNHCECGELHEEGICKICGCRVIRENNVPDFYIDLGVKVPKLFADFGKYKDVQSLLEFKSFLFKKEGEWRIINLGEDSKNFDPDNEDLSQIKIGLDAAREIHPDIDEWANIWMTDFISVPHPVFRPNLRMDNGKIFFSPVNKSLIGILKNLEFVNEYKELFDDSESRFNYFLLAFYYTIYEYYIEGMQEIFKLFAGNKKSFVGSDLKSHRLTSAIKGTVVNRFDLDEDIILIGDTFIQTLYPYLFTLYDGDMEKINEHFIKNEERVLVNRPPTICHLSIMAMKPRVASCYKFGTFEDGAVAPNQKSDYCEEEDTIGIRAVAINPIVTDGIAGDFDGDTLLVISLFSDKAKKEADTMLPSGNFMNYANGSIRNKIIEDVEYVRGK